MNLIIIFQIIIVVVCNTTIVNHIPTTTAIKRQIGIPTTHVIHISVVVEIWFTTVDIVTLKRELVKKLYVFVFFGIPWCLQQSSLATKSVVPYSSRKPNSRAKLCDYHDFFQVSL